MIVAERKYFGVCKMEYKLIITKENGDISAELQTLDQSHRQAFNLLDVILDYTNIKRTEQREAWGGLKTYFDLQNHVFGCLFSNTEVPYDAAWMELRYDNVKKSFQFLSEAEPVLKESRKLSHKRARGDFETSQKI